MAKKEKKAKARLRILVIDGNNYVHRGYHAVQPLSTKKGFPTNAIKGTFNILLKDIEELKPDRLVVTFDKGGKKGWRSEIYPEYKQSKERVKAKNDDKYKEVKEQFKPIRKIIKAMGIRILCKAGVEADDYMGTLAKEFEEQGHEVLISTGDKDIASMVTKNVSIVTAKDREILDPVGIKMKFGVKPNQIVEYLMLLGDSVDNIPGVEKVGPTTAAKWLSEYGTLKNLLANVDDMIPKQEYTKAGKPKKLKPAPVVVQNLLRDKKHFKLTRKLITLKTNVKHSVTIENCDFAEPDFDKIKKLCEKFELKETHKLILKCLKKREGSAVRWAL